MTVVEIPFIGPHAPNREKPLSSQVTKNMWPEINPEARNQVSLHNTAGLRTVANLGGADRGLHDFNNLLYAVNGNKLYSIDDVGTSIELGTIAGTNRTVMASSPFRILIATGLTLYQYTTTAGVEPVVDANVVNPTWVFFLNSQFLMDKNNGIPGEYVVAPDAGTSDIDVDPLDFATAESHPDDIIRGIKYRQLAYFFGIYSGEPWRNTGKGNPPFARQDSGIRSYGIAGLHAITTTDEFIYFLDTKRRPRRSNGLDYIPIGTPSIGVEFVKYSRIDDCIVFEFTQDDQQFVAYTFPTANRTWCYHEPSGSWFQMVFGAKNDRHRATSMIKIYGLNFCADHSNGKLYEYSLDIFTDDGTPIVKQRDTAPIHGGLYGVPGKKLEFNEVEFIIASGTTEVAGLGLGAQPIIADQGICGTDADLTQGQLLGVGLFVDGLNAARFLLQDDPESVGVAMADTNVISFTCAFTREADTLPDVAAGTFVSAIQVYSGDTTLTYFGFNIDENGFMNITARNRAGTSILDAQITNNGSTFADGEFYLFSVVIDLADEDRREIYINNAEVGATSVTTWNTYTNDFIYLDDTEPGIDLSYDFGQTLPSLVDWADTGPAKTTLGFLTVDNTCSLIASSCWDKNGVIRDPQAWQGWYKTQPHAAWLTSFHKNSGKVAPATLAEITAGNGMELDFDDKSSDTAYSNGNTDEMIYNFGIGATVSTTDKDVLPDPPAAATPVELVEPFWLNTGSFIDLSKLTQTTFESMFGVVVEGADFNKDVTVNRAALVNTSDSGNRIQLRDSSVYANGYLAVVNSSGTIIDSLIYSGVPNGDSVLVPTGADYYVIITSDSTTAKVKKWDSVTTSTTGAVSFESVFGFEVGERVYANVSASIPAGGKSIWFTAPVTTESKIISFISPQNSSTNSSKTASISETVGDFTGLINGVIGNNDGIAGGINFTGSGVATLVPGNIYILNFKYDTGESNPANIQYNYADAP